MIVLVEQKNCPLFSIIHNRCSCPLISRCWKMDGPSINFQMSQKLKFQVKGKTVHHFPVIHNICRWIWHSPWLSSCLIFFSKFSLTLYNNIRSKRGFMKGMMMPSKILTVGFYHLLFLTMVLRIKLFILLLPPLL